MVLAYFLSSEDVKDHEKFLSLVLEWPPSLYDVKNVITALKQKLKDTKSDILMDALAKM
jgi:hypothetical protein